MDKVFEIGVVESVNKIDIENTQIIFHGINKSGSYAMATAMRDAYILNGRQKEFFAHYFTGGEIDEYINSLESWKGPGFHVAHYLYGKLKPRHNRILLTQFRHPLPRVLSCYNWLKVKHLKKNPAVEFPSFDDWLVDTKGVKHSMLIQFGAGYGKFSKGLTKRLSRRDLLEISIDSIEREVYCYGIAEYFEESIFLFASLCGLNFVKPWVRDERNLGRILSSQVNERTKALVEEIYFYDYKLYSYVLKKFLEKTSGFINNKSLEMYKQHCITEYNDRIL